MTHADAAGPEITAVIPTYRRRELLRRAIDSVLGQTYPHLKVAVFDNASSDGTREAVAEIMRRDRRVHYHCHKRNLGAAKNFQAALDSVDTPYFSFLSDDDFLLPGFYEHAMECLGAGSVAAFFCGQTVKYSPTQGTHLLSPTVGWQNGTYRAGEAAVTMARYHFTWTSCVFSGRVRQRVGRHDDLRIGDIPFLVKAAAMFPFCVSLVPCAVFSTWAEGESAATPLPEVVEAYGAMRASIASAPEIGPEQMGRIDEALKEKLSYVAGGRFRSSFMSGDWKTFGDAARCLRRLGRLTAGRRLRAMIAGQRMNGSLLLMAARALLSLRDSLRRRARGQARPVSAGDMIRLYGPLTAASGPDRSAHAGAAGAPEAG